MWYVTFKVHRSFVTSDYQECHMLFLYRILFIHFFFKSVVLQLTSTFRLA